MFASKPATFTDLKHTLSFHIQHRLIIKSQHPEKMKWLISMMFTLAVSGPLAHACISRVYNKNCNQS